MTNSNLNLNTPARARLLALIEASKAKKNIAGNEVVELMIPMAMPVQTSSSLVSSPLQESISLPETETGAGNQTGNQAQNQNQTPKNISTGSYDLNQRQSLALRKALELQSFCLIGSAGTGKTTVVREIAKALALSDKMTLITEDCKVLKAGQAGIFCCSFTNIAVQNIASQMQGAVTCTTIHNVLEYAPVYLEEVNAETGNTITKRVFEPGRTKNNPLPSGIRVIIIEESGVVGTRLFNQLKDSLPNAESITFIFLGDLYQLPPVFDNPILGHKLLELPIIELTEVYRQALESPILNLAIQVKDGKQMSFEKVKLLNSDNEHGKLEIKHFQKKTTTDDALHLFQGFMEKLMDSGSYNPDTTMILIPYNVNFGTVECNKIISHLFDKKENREVYEVIAGFEKKYFAVGDIIYSRKRKAVITKISKNGKYLGKMPVSSSKTLDRWGIDSSMSIDHPIGLETQNIMDIDSIMAALESDSEVRKEAASHLIDIKFIGGENEGGEDTLDSASELNELIGGYCLTVHKAQGSEWENGICWFHNSHARFISRELLYTAFTRFKRTLLVICEKDTFIKGINNQALKGTSLVEKLESLKLKLRESENSFVRRN